MAKQKTHEEFLEQLKSVNPNVKPLTNYVRSSEPVLCRCLVCGLEWEIRPNNLLRGYGCPVCGLKKRVNGRTKDKDTFAQELETISPEIDVLGEYIGARKYIGVKCKKCGHKRDALPTNLLKGRKCPQCARVIRAQKNSRSNEEFLYELHSINPNIVAQDVYAGNQRIIKFQCAICNYTWNTSPSSVLSGHGCPRCAKNGTYSQQEFKEKVKSINPEIEAVGNYKRANIPMEFKCKICGHKWNSRPNNILSGKGCPNCYHSNTSFVEEALFEALSLSAGDVEVIQRNKSLIGKEIDIYIPELKIAIEPGSWRWHKSNIKSDIDKRQRCSNLGIRLITIYTDYTETKPPFDTDCFVYRETIGFEKDIDVLKSLVDTVLNICGWASDFDEDEWNNIVQIAYKNSRRRTTLEYAALLAAKHPSVEVVGDYTGAWNRIEVKCLECSNVWSPSANSLLQGHGCPKCSSRLSGIARRKNAETFASELLEVNFKIELLGQYEKSDQPVKCRCKLCGYEWEALPNNLLKGKGCRRCTNISSGKMKRKSQDVFLKQVKEKHPKIKVLSDYCKSDENVRCRCEKCNHTWDAKPSALLSGRGCPKCAIAKRNMGKCKPVVQVETGQEFESISAAADYVGTTGGNISACLKGKTKTAKGYHWEYSNT